MLINTYQSLKFVTDVLFMIKYYIQFIITKYIILDLYDGINYPLSSIRKYFSQYIENDMYISNANFSP